MAISEPYTVTIAFKRGNFTAKKAKICHSPFSLHPPQNKWPQFVKKKLLP